MQGWHQERGPDYRTHVVLPGKGWHLGTGWRFTKQLSAILSMLLVSHCDNYLNASSSVPSNLAPAGASLLLSHTGKLKAMTCLRRQNL